jgi:hypothetical protein
MLQLRQVKGGRMKYTSAHTQQQRMRLSLAPRTQHVVAAAATHATPTAPAAKRKRDSTPDTAGRRSPARAAKKGGCLAEDTHDDGTTECERDESTRYYWEQFPTPLLFAWLRKHSDTVLRADASNRSKLLDTLVNEHIAQPSPSDATHAGAELQRVWEAANGGHAGRTSSPISLEHDIEHEEEHASPTPVMTSLPLTFHSTVPAAAAAPAALDACRTCCRARPPAGTATWLCICGLRGDLDSSHATNTTLFSMMLHGRANPPGQSQDTRVGTAAKGQTKLESDFERQTAALPAFPLFSSTTPTSQERIFSELGTAYQATLFSLPNTYLLDLIRAGKLIHVGHAMPKTIASAAAADSDGAISAIFIGANSIATQGKGNAIPTCGNLRDFFSALVCTILPALNDCPEAQLSWLTLARTVIKLDEMHGWQAAHSYMEQLLTLRVTQRQPFGPVSNEVLTTILFGGMHATPRPQQSQGNQQQRPAQAKPQSDLACRNFNKGGCSNSATFTCKYSHKCFYAGRAGCPGTPAHSGATCPARNDPANADLVAALGTRVVRPVSAGRR